MPRVNTPTKRETCTICCACLARGLHIDAARILLRALPKRYAVAWCCECFKGDGEREPLPPAEPLSLQSAEAWVTEGDERTRQAAFAQAEAGNFDTAGAWLAAAAAFSSGSLTPPGYAGAPADHLTADACFAAICLLAARDPGSRHPPRRLDRTRAHGICAQRILGGRPPGQCAHDAGGSHGR